MSLHHKRHPTVLVILDGWGHCLKTEHNPTQSVKTPTFDALYQNHPHTLLEASGTAVGLPEGQMGNSEVGHLHLGAGRKVPQDLSRINESIRTGDFFRNSTLKKALNFAKARNSAVHIIGLLSPGGVHSQNTHLSAMIKMVHATGIAKNYLHAILDGRDTPPKSARIPILESQKLYEQLGQGKIASLIGRYYAMDRDKRWDRTKKAYDLLTAGVADFHSTEALTGLEQAYAKGITDEFIPPTSLHPEQGKPIMIEDNDVVVFMNFRADRARQLSYAFCQNDFAGFTRRATPKLSHCVTLTQYAKSLNASVAFPPRHLKNTLGECVSNHQLKQLRIAETEKYAHVTYFFNGGQEVSLPGEERKLIPSPHVATYDLQPEMSALQVTEELTAAIHSKAYDLIVCNYANPDMVGHTGMAHAAAEAVSVIDRCVAKVLAALKKVGGQALITADHGNIECMYNTTSQQPHTAHTQNPVPLIYFGHNAKFSKEKAALDDVAPTILHLMNLEKPAEMTGRNLISLE